MAKRFYSLQYTNTNKPVYLEQAGSLLKISGILVQSMGNSFVLLAPNAMPVDQLELKIVEPSLDEWCEFIRRTDDPLVFEQDETGTIKAIHRKQKFAISGTIQQKIWVRDGCQCLLCGKMMGDVQMTIDHWIPLELGGAETASNLISCCRRCNKNKGSIHPQEYCATRGIDYEGLCLYLDGKCSRAFLAHLDRQTHT